MRIFTAVAMLTLPMASAAPAGATVIDRGRYSVEFEDGYDDCGLQVAAEVRLSGTYRIRAGTGANEGAFFLRDNVSYTETHTNVATGESFSVEGRWLFNEVRASHVDGNVFEFSAVQAGRSFVVFDSDGRVVLHDRGVVQFRVLFDTGGDNEPGGELLVEEVQFHGPHPGAEVDFCDLVTSLLGS
jgi:hypothetical protein